MRIVVSDSSCLIDLRKVSLLDVLLELPYEILIPNTLFEDELLKFSDAEKQALIRGGLKVVDLPGEHVLRARQLIRSVPHLSVNDGFAFVLAESHDGCILLTGDAHLRKLAVTHKIEVHGILWIIDQIYANRLKTGRTLHRALRLLAKDPAVRLPRPELSVFLKRYQDLE
jgi:predicted nucleic acid-binding protein